jgi:hypothetical protein
VLNRRVGVLAGLLAIACLLATPAWAGSRACGAAPYSYAGFQGARHATSVSATIGVRSAPQVSSGHVMAWVGVGGPGEGPRGTDEWLQVGISAFPGSAPNVYYEVQKPDGTYRYIGVLGLLKPGEKHRVAIHETSRAGWWRVFVDGKRVSSSIHLPGSHGRWFGDAEAENWNGGHAACNHLDFSFEDIAVGETSSLWSPLFTGRLLQDPGYRVIRGEPNAFVASSV